MTNLSCTQIGNDLVVGTLNQLPDSVVIIAEVDEEAMRYVPERTCHKVIPDEMEGYVFCSECGAEIGEYNVPNYCHMCGAKVVEE